jgi:glycosyltransferase involved in cell wall biosynthesis
MHVLILAPAIPDYTVEFANALVRRAHVTVIAPRRYFGHLEPFFDPAIDLRLVDWPRHRSLRNIAFMAKLVRAIGSISPDVIHCVAEGVTWLAFMTPVLCRYGLVTTMHDLSHHLGDRQSRRVPRWFGNRLVRHSSRVIVHGASLREAAERQYPALRGKIDCLPHLELRRYAEIAARQGMRRRGDAKVNILFFGRIFAYKGLDVLIRSISIVTRRFADISVVIAGQGDDIAPYRDMMANPELFCIEHRYIPDIETAQLFTDADIVVLPYIAASQSGVLAISTAFGKPAIVTDVGALGHCVQHGVTGMVVQPNDVQALADAILVLAENAELRAAMGVAARDLASQAASPETIAEQAVGIYQRIGRPRTGNSVALVK